MIDQTRPLPPSSRFDLPRPANRNAPRACDIQRERPVAFWTVTICTIWGAIDLLRLAIELAAGIMP